MTTMLILDPAWSLAEDHPYTLNTFVLGCRLLWEQL